MLGTNFRYVHPDTLFDTRLIPLLLTISNKFKINLYPLSFHFHFSFFHKIQISKFKTERQTEFNFLIKLERQYKFQGLPIIPLINRVNENHLVIQLPVETNNNKKPNVKSLLRNPVEGSAFSCTIVVFVSTTTTTTIIGQILLLRRRDWKYRPVYQMLEMEHF